jgi:hypothetical protein
MTAAILAPDRDAAAGVAVPEWPGTGWTASGVRLASQSGPFRDSAVADGSSRDRDEPEGAQWRCATLPPASVRRSIAWNRRSVPGRTVSFAGRGHRRIGEVRVRSA